jgi:glycosyltransferase involved in cell wall biosynthesis
MYPSKESPFYGVFVKNFEQELGARGVIFEKAVIRGRGGNILQKILKYIKFFKDVYGSLKLHNYDLIYIHYAGHSLLPIYLFRKNIKKPLVINTHGGDIITNSTISNYILKLITPIIKRADLIVSPSSYFQNIVSKKFNIDKNRIYVSPSGGVNRELFHPIEVERDIFTIGFVSRIDRGKGWEILLDAIYQVSQNPNTKKFQVLMIGKGFQEEILKQKIADLNLQNIVKFLGAKPHSELPHYFNMMDISVFPTTLNESLGLVGVEAMACGVPVIGSDIGGLTSYIEDGVNGKLFRAGDSSELAQNIEFFLSAEERVLNDYRENALNSSKKFDSKLVAENLLNKLKGLIIE